MQTPNNRNGGSNFGINPSNPNVPQMPPLSNTLNNSPFANNPNNATGQNVNTFPFLYMPNNTYDYYNKNVPIANTAYGSYNNQAMYPQSNGFPLPPPDTASGSNTSTGTIPPYVNPNAMKYYNKDIMMMNEAPSQKKTVPTNHSPPIMPMQYMNNYSMDNRNNEETVGVTPIAAPTWIEMVAKNGRKFYYNPITRCSKWEKPDELKTPEEIKIAQRTKWVEYTCSDGRKYWYHEEKNMSVWKEPEEIKLIRAECAKELSEENMNNNVTNTDSNNNTSNKDKEKVVEWPTAIKENTHAMYPFPMDNMISGGAYYFAETDNINKERNKKGNKKKGNICSIQKQGGNINNGIEAFADKHEARMHLKKLFEEKITNPKMTWDSAVKVLETDKTWPLLSILTKGEKRQMYSEYSSTAVKRAAENERKKRQKSREIIFQTLLNWNKLDEKTTYEDFAKEFYQKEWWDWITERERDEILQDFIDDYKNKFREDRRKKRKVAMGRLKEKFQSYAENKENPLKWEIIKIRFEEDEDFKILHKLDALATWESFYEKYHMEEKEKLKKKVYRIFRKKRDAFSDLLNEYYEQNILNVKTEWVFFVSKIYKDERYTDLLGNPGSTPRMLFDEFIKSLQQKYLKHKVYMKKACKEKNFEMKKGITFEEFMEYFKKYQKKYEIPDIHMNFIYQSMQKKITEKKKKEEKHIKKLTRFLIKNKELKPNMSYEKVLSILKCSSKWGNICILCPKEEQKIAAYNMWKIHVNSKQKHVESESELSDYEYRKFKKNRSRKLKSYQYPEEKEEAEEAEDETENMEKEKEMGEKSDSGSSASYRKKSLKESEGAHTESSSHTIESLRTIDNVD